VERICVLFILATKVFLLQPIVPGSDELTIKMSGSETVDHYSLLILVPENAQNYVIIDQRKPFGEYFCPFRKISQID